MRISEYMGGFLNNSQIEVFCGQLGSFFFEIFLIEFIVCTYLKVCEWLDVQETPHRGRGYFIHDDRHMIPWNDLLIVSSL